MKIVKTWAAIPSGDSAKILPMKAKFDTKKLFRPLTILLLLMGFIMPSCENPSDPGNDPSDGDNPDKLYEVIVNFGTGSGKYKLGQSVTITANDPSDKQVWDSWTGDDAILSDSKALSNTFAMPANQLNFTATYRDLEADESIVEVLNGSGSGVYNVGDIVTVTATIPVGKIFNQWTGNIETLTNAMTFETSLTVPNYNVSVGATFKDVYTSNALGSVVHIPSDAVMNLAVDFGAKWVRITNVWVFHSNACNFSRFKHYVALDRAVDYAKQLGFEVFMSLGDTPPCASIQNNDNIRNNDVPNAALYEGFTRKTVAHYRAKGVRHFGIWNEPNLPQFFEGSVDQWVNNIAAPGFRGITAGCADSGHNDCLILGPETAHIGDYDKWMIPALQKLNKLGMIFDIVVHHIYNDPERSVFDGDSFLNALEKRRYSFTKPSLMDVFNDTGYLDANKKPIKELWIGETGHQTQPPTDSKEMDFQNWYAQKVIDYQLDRPYWTNTFFYQLKDSWDELDGFGMARGESAQHPERNWFKKPVFNGIRDRIYSEDGLVDARLR